MCFHIVPSHFAHLHVNLIFHKSNLISNVAEIDECAASYHASCCTDIIPDYIYQQH